MQLLMPYTPLHQSRTLFKFLVWSLSDYTMVMIWTPNPFEDFIVIHSQLKPFPTPWSLLSPSGLSWDEHVSCYLPLLVGRISLVLCSDLNLRSPPYVIPVSCLMLPSGCWNKSFLITKPLGYSEAKASRAWGVVSSFHYGF